MVQQAGSASDVSTAPILIAIPQPKRMLMHALALRLHTLSCPASLFACSACCSLTATTVCAQAVGVSLAAQSCDPAGFRSELQTKLADAAG